MLTPPADDAAAVALAPALVPSPRGARVVPLAARGVAAAESEGDEATEEGPEPGTRSRRWMMGLLGVTSGAATVALDTDVDDDEVEADEGAIGGLPGVATEVAEPEPELEPGPEQGPKPEPEPEPDPEPELALGSETAGAIAGVLDNRVDPEPAFEGAGPEEELPARAAASLSLSFAPLPGTGAATVEAGDDLCCSSGCCNGCSCVATAGAGANTNGACNSEAVPVGVDAPLTVRAGKEVDCDEPSEDEELGGLGKGAVAAAAAEVAGGPASSVFAPLLASATVSLLTARSASCVAREADEPAAEPPPPAVDAAALLGPAAWAVGAAASAVAGDGEAAAG